MQSGSVMARRLVPQYAMLLAGYGLNTPQLAAGSFISTGEGAESQTLMQGGKQQM